MSDAYLAIHRRMKRLNGIIVRGLLKVKMTADTNPTARVPRPLVRRLRRAMRTAKRIRERAIRLTAAHFIAIARRKRRAKP